MLQANMAGLKKNQLTRFFEVRKIWLDRKELTD